MSDGVQFQSATPATPPAATVVATDNLSGTHHQLIKIEFGDNGTAYAVSYGTPLPIGTLPGGTFSVNGTLQVLGSVSIVGTLAGGTVGILGTVQGLGTYQPLAGSVHLASRLPGTVDVGTIAGTVSVLGTYQPLAGSVHVANTISGTVQTHGTSQVLGTVAIASVGTLAASLAKREDVTHNDSDVGVMFLGVRRDTAATAAANGEYTAISTDSTGRVRVNTGPDLVDSGNSSTTTLAGGATFTGTGIEVTEYSSIVVNAFSDVASATDGLQLQFSQNNTNWDFSITVSASAATAAALKSGAIARYARVVYTNGASVQTTFRLQTILKGEAIPQVAKPTGDNLAATDLAVTGKSVLAGRVDGGSSFRNVEIANTTPTASVVGLVVRVAGTPQFLGTVQTHGTSQAIGTVQLHGTNQALGTVQPLAGSVHVANTVSGTVQVHGTVPVGTVAGTVSALGTVQPLAGSVHLATNLAGGTVVSVGSAVHGAVADTRPHLIGVFGSSGTPAAVDDGDAVRLWADLNGRLQIRGTIDSMPAISVTQGTIPGGTVQLHGTSQILGTVRALTEVTVTVGTIAEGTIQSFTGTAQVLGTVQPLAGSVHLATGFPGGTVVTVGSAVHGAVADTRPHLMAAFGSSGTQAAVDDGDSVRLWADLNGRLQVRGTIDSIPSITIGAALPAGDNNIGNVDVVTMPTVTVTGTVQTHGTVSVGTVAGTVSVLGTIQTLAGSVHLASILPGGSVSAQGYVAHDAVAAGNPLLMGAFGSSGTQAAIADGDAVRLWADLNGRLQVRGTIDSLPSVTVGNTVAVTGTVQTHGTSQALGTVQPLAGSVHLATNLAGGTVVNVGSAVHGAAADTRPLLMGVFGSSGTQAAVDDGDSTRLWADLNGRLQVRGTIDSIPAITITAGTVSLNTGGTIHIGTVQRVAGTVDIGTIAGTVAVRTAFPTFGSYFGSAFTAATSNGTLIAPLGQGTRWRLHDVTVSASAAGTVQLTEATSGSVVWGPLFFAANGGFQSNSALGYRARGTNLGLFVTTSAGTTSVTVNYQLETP